MQYLREKLYPTSVKQKVIAGFSLAFVAIILALGISHFSFREMLDTIDELSAPNEKLSLLNNVFEEITTLDQVQRADAIRNPRKSFKTFQDQSQSVTTLIDTLLLLPWDSVQFDRLMAMNKVLEQRNKIFYSYLRLKSELASGNAHTNNRLDTLSTILEKSQTDTSIVTTQKKTTTTYWIDSTQEQKAQEEKSFLGRLFGKKKTEPVPSETHVKVEEEFSVQVDTVAVARQNHALEEVERIMAELESSHQKNNKRLQRSELELIHANSLFINQLLTILHEVENEELFKMRLNDQRAGVLFNQSISRIALLLLVFFLGAALLVYLIWIDISKSNYYREQLEKSRDEAEELSQIKQRFLANMSHEIRTPLQSIIGFAEQLKQPSGAHSYEAAAAIHSSSEHLLHIVNEVLDYSRISSGNFSLAEEPFVLKALISEVESAMRVQADKKDLTFLLDNEQAVDCTLLGDPFRLRQILYNLLGNAIKFTNKGFVRLTIKTFEQHESVRCVFEVTDTGIGIRAEDLKKVFNQFEQASTTVAEHYGGGSGLGLTIVKSLVEVQKGTLEVTSEPGIGSTFRVMLVFKKSPAEIRIQESIKSLRTKVFPGKVLLVDDDPMILRLCGLILTKFSIRHTLFLEAEKLLDMLPDPEVSHILMDIRMPRINGIELCQALRKKYNVSVKFIALTAHVFPQERQKLLNEGFDRVLPKPFHEQELAEVLEIYAQPQAVVEPDNQISSFDFTIVRQMTLGDESLFHSVINQFVEETETDLDLLNDSLKTMDTATMREIVHKLAGRVGQMGALSLSSRLRLMEEQIDRGDKLGDYLESFITLKDEVEDLIRSIRVMTL